MRRAVAEVLSTARHDAGLSQVALGKRAGVSGKFVGELERMEKSVSLDTLARLARGLKTVTVGVLLLRIANTT